MINLTKNIKIIETNIKDHFIHSLNNVKNKIRQIEYRDERFNSFLTLNTDNLDDFNIDNMLEYSMDKNFKDVLVEYRFIDTYKLLDKPYLMACIKLTLIDLWFNKKILLPVRFNYYSTLIEDLLNDYKNDIIKNLETNILNKKGSIDKNDDVYLKSVYKVIFSSNYFNSSDISLTEINALHIKIIEAKKGENDCVPITTRISIDTLLKDLNDLYSLKKYDGSNYKSWLSGYFSRYKRMDYLEFINSLDDLKERRRLYNIEQTIERNKKSNIKISRRSNYTDLNQNNAKKTIREDIESPEKDFREILKGQNSWNLKIPDYSIYNIHNIESESSTWLKLKEAYFIHRKRNGYESSKSITVTLNFLFNYIFFYLNHWNNKHVDNKIQIPKSPKEFHRTLFFNNTLISSNVDERPFTIIELLNYFYDAPTQKNSIIRNLDLFFKFIEDFYFEDEEVWSKSLSNPIRKNDYFRMNKNKKTDKVIIPKDTYICLKKYLYAIEFFGEYLLDNILKNENFINFDLAKVQTINTEDFGLTPIFFHQGKYYPIKTISNTFLYKKRLIEIKGEVKEQLITSNTIIRAFILMLNTGLRSAQVKWLDKNTWNIDDKEKVQAYYKINVNTDKSHDKWITYVPHQVYQSLLKETEFQNSLKEEFVNTLVNYQNRDFTRFEDINCLFKSYSEKGNPIEITKYWADILWAFQNTLNNVNEKECQLIYFNQEEVNLRTSVEGLEYCELRAYAVHTPHSMRATFCTHMAEYLERNEIAALVGHSSSLVTSEVYIKPEDNTIKNKMERANDIFENSVNADYFNKDSSTHIKPNLNQSSLQKAFLKDREQTIELFNVSSISMSINHESETQSKKAVELLKNARMDHIVFETTHICPVGGVCPQEVMSIISEKRRCGLCPLALKCIDNLNPIYAKQRDLIREIKEGKEQLDNAINNKESSITINNLEDKINLDIRELVSWKFSADVLSAHYEKIKDNKDLEKKYYVEMPDMVKQHLEKVSISNEKEYLLTRIADANAYSAYNNPDNKYQAEMIKRHVIKNLGLFEYDDYYVSEEEKIQSFCSMIHNMLQTNGVNLKQLLEYDCFKSIQNTKKVQKLEFTKMIKLENKKGE